MDRTAELASTNATLSTENLERQWANQALEHQLRYNHLIVDSINDLVFVLTKALNISRVNSGRDAAFRLQRVGIGGAAAVADHQAG